MGDRPGYGYREFRPDVMWLRDSLPNLSSFCLDDFFQFNSGNNNFQHYRELVPGFILRDASYG